MFFEKIQNVDSEKIAISAEGKSITFGNILTIAQKRAGFFENKRESFLLCHSSELENLFNFFAIIAVGGRAIFAGKNLTEEQKNGISVIHNCSIIDFVPDEATERESFYKPTKNEYFLGVLSSGTTGQSKLIWKDYQSWFSAFPHQSTVFGVSEQDTVFVLDALAYSANLNTVLHTLWQGAKVVLGKLSEAASWLKVFDKQEVTSAFLVPSHIRLLLAHQPFGKINLRSLVSAGEKLDAKLAKLVLDVIPGVLLTEYYGAAELGHVSYAQNQDIVEYPTTVGKAFPGVEIEIKDDKIFVESSYISPEYRSIRTVFDFGFLDSTGRLCVFGREGRMFNRRGLNIFAEEIENAALQHPFVKEAVLIANAQKSHILELIVVVKQEISKSELQDFLLQKITKDKLPNKIVFSPSIPRNDAGKVDFRVIAKKPVDEENLVR
ncbi:MAG TPA: AMP-binding protein [Leadbetterella sp.]|nr:AMP-binding protein [Leadbetterella sp.]